MTVKRKITAVSSAAMLTAALVVGTGPGASAAPQGCGYEIVGRIASSHCASGTGWHRIFVMQRHILPDVGLLPIWGPWQPPGTVSSVQITYHETLYARVETTG